MKEEPEDLIPQVRHACKCVSRYDRRVICERLGEEEGG
jgi:hypothetical protein